MESIIALNVTNSKSYQEYRTIVTQLVEQNSTSGNDTSEAMVNYTMLNDRRMKRWDKTIKVSDEVYSFIGHSGSVYKGHISTYGTNMYSQGILNQLIESAKDQVEDQQPEDEKTLWEKIRGN